MPLPLLLFHCFYAIFSLFRLYPPFRAFVNIHIDMIMRRELCCLPGSLRLRDSRDLKMPVQCSLPFGGLHPDGGAGMVAFQPATFTTCSVPVALSAPSVESLTSRLLPWHFRMEF